MTGWYQDKPYMVIAQCSNLLFVRCLWGRIKEYAWVLLEDLENIDHEPELMEWEGSKPEPTPDYLVRQEQIFINSFAE